MDVRRPRPGDRAGRASIPGARHGSVEVRPDHGDRRDREAADADRRRRRRPASSGEESGRVVATPDPRPRRLRPRRGRASRRRSSPPSSAGRATASRQPRRLDHHDRPQPRHRPPPARAARTRQARQAARACALRATTDGRTASTDRQAHRRRPAAADLHLLPPGARAGGAGGARRCAPLGGLTTAEIARAFLRARADDGPAAGPGQAQDPRRRHPVPRADRRRAARRAPTPCSRSSTWSSTRATRPPPATSWSATTCAPRRSAWPGCSSRCMPDEPEAAGLLALMLLHRRPARRPGADGRATWCCSRTRTARAGTAPQIAEGTALVRAGAARAASPGRTSCRPPSPRSRGAPPTPEPTGRRSLALYDGCCG